MKKIVLLIYIPVLLMSGNLKDALLQAKREHKPLMIYVKSDACAFCDKMKNNTLSDASIQANIQDFIFVTTDKSSSEAQKYLPATRYTPTVYFISSELKAVNTVKGYLAKDDFNLWINDSKLKLGMNNQENNVIETTVKSENWFYDIASAEDYAKQVGKQVMIYVENSNNEWSAKMRSETLSEQKVKDALENFVWVKLQKGSAEANAYGLQPVMAPTVYFRRANGTPLAKAKGYFDVTNFMLWINYAKGQI